MKRMMNYKIVIMITVLGVFYVSICSLSSEDLLREIEAKATKNTTYKANVEFIDPRGVTKGIQYVKHLKKQRLEVDVFDVNGNKVASFLRIKDGEKDIFYNKTLNRVEIGEINENVEMHPFYDVAKNNNLKEIVQKDTKYLLTYSSEKKPNLFIRMEIGRDAGLIERIVYYVEKDDEDVVLYETRYNNFDVESKISDNLFVFDIPEGASVSDKRKVNIKE